MSITGIYPCPACEQTITFRSAATNAITCSHCNAVIEKKQTDGTLMVRTDVQLVQENYSPIQIGTSGEWEGKKFEIIGRTRCVLAEGYTNNWTMHCDDDRILLLVESFGQFGVYEKIQPDHDISFSSVKALDYGSGTVNFWADKNYILEKQSFCKSIEVEGEAWLYETGGRYTCLEIAAQDGSRAALLQAGDETYVTFVIHYYQLNDLQFEQLRNVQGGLVRKELTCGQCNATVHLYSWPLAESFCCTNCDALYVLHNGNWEFRRKLQRDRTPAIPLYAIGTINQTEYQLVGFMEKQDGHGYQWREYTLFNPVLGYAFLSEYNGHWIFLKEMANAPVLVNNHTLDFMWRGRAFELYNKYGYSLVECRGEFPGDAYDFSGIDCREYIAPPQMWARELGPSGILWFYGENITGKELRAAFGNEITLPYKMGVGAVQPVVGQVNMNTLITSILGALLGFVLLFLLTIMFNEEKVVYENEIVLPDSTHLPPVVTAKFRLDKWRSNMDFEINSSLDNDWLDVAITLVNADNGKEYAVEKGLEKYHGYEDGESWSEGSNSDDVLLHSIPAGTYFLQIEPTRGSKMVDRFTVKVTYDVPMWHNFFIFVLLALLPAIGLYISMYYRDRLRWQNSPFSPNNKSND